MRVSLESIVNPSADPRLRRMINVCGDLLAAHKLKKPYNPVLVELKKLCQKDYGLNITWEVVESPMPNAGIDLTRIGTFLARAKLNPGDSEDTYRNIFGDSIGRPVAEAIAAFKSLDLGAINLAEGYVTGPFSKVECEGGMTTGIFETFPAEQIADVILHEIGHAIDDMSAVGAACIGMFEMEAITQDYAGIAKGDRVRYLNEAIKATGRTDINVKDLAKEDSASVVASVIADQLLTPPEDTIRGGGYYVTRGERFADNFPIRLGSTTIHKTIMKLEGGFFPHHPVLWLIASLPFLAFFHIVTVVIILVKIRFATDPNANAVVGLFADVHGEYKQRLRAIREGYIGYLKKGAKGEAAKEYLKRIDEIDAEMSGLWEEHTSLLRALIMTVSLGGRKFRSTRNRAEYLTKLASNDLFVDAASIKALSE